MRRNDPAVGQDLAQVVEHDHAVAEQAPCSWSGCKANGAGQRPGPVGQPAGTRVDGDTWAYALP